MAKFRIGDRVTMSVATRLANPRARSFNGTVTRYYRSHPGHIYVRQDGYKRDDWWSEEAWELLERPAWASVSVFEAFGAGC